MQFAVIREIERKELNLFFASPTGYLFITLFLAVTLFTFFWLEAFFARNIADVRPMFEAMPVLMIFLSSAISMRMWSEERRTGTLEFVATLPASTWEFVLGKFLACWLLLALALALTLPLPLTISFIANLDWGPVFAGYVAALLLGAAYLAIGLYVSAKSQSQIVALLISALVCGLFYMLGASMLTNYTGGWLTELLYSLGSGSRFASIARGILDVRDLYYYVSIAAAFLTLNVYALERERWADDAPTARHRAWQAGTALLVLNILVANVWLANVSSLRFDLTEGRQYTLSQATRSYLDQLREPMLIRGYFSEKTHALLAPLVPRMKDLLREYEQAGGGRVRVEIVDPAKDAQAEDEANTKYGIRSVPFQVEERYGSALVNAYFDVLILYGDEYEVLDFRDLIEVKAKGETDLDVQLRNPEFDLTRSIKKVLYGFQGGGSLFANIADPVSFTGYVSSDERLPEALADFRETLQTVLGALESESDGKFSAELIDPDADGGAVAEEIAASYGFQPMAMSLLDPNTFYFYLTLKQGDTVVQIPIPEALSEDATRKGIEEGLKRFASGLLKSMALVAPAPPAPTNPYMPQQGAQFTQLQDFLASDFDVETTDLTEGEVPASAELLMVVDAENLNEKQLFAVDQFLMRGGTVVLATAPFDATIAQQSLTAARQTSGLEDWLAHHGVTIGESLVMDPQNAAFPVPVTREVGGFSFQELVMLDYPYFVDIRPDGMSDEAFLQGLPQITVPWASPIELKDGAAEQFDVTELLRSSNGAWLSDDKDVVPKADERGVSGFVPEGDTASRLLAVGLQGRFTSYFQGQKSPLLEAAETQPEEPEDSEDATDPVFASVVEKSPESARLFVFASNGFLSDQTLRMVGAADGMLYGNTVQMMANLVDWALEDDSLTGIRARGNFNRTLPPMEPSTQTTIEYLNYIVALLGVLAVYLVYGQIRRRKQRTVMSWMQGGEA